MAERTTQPDLVRRRSLARGAGAILFFGALLVTGCANDNKQNSLEPEGEAARKIMDLFTPFFWIAVVVFVLVAAILLTAVFRFRSRPGHDQDPVQVHGNTKMEIGWTIAPALLLIIMGIFTVPVIFELSKDPGPDALQIKVIGKQWWWSYEYSDLGVVTANEMHVPVGRKVELTMTSDNVIHSFWIPNLAGKEDVVPGRDTKIIFSADKPGIYRGQCAEYCGLSHANMRLRVIVDTPEDFDTWVENQSKPVANRDEAAEDIIRKYGCGACHTLDGLDYKGTVGPDLTHLASRETIAGATLELNSENLAKWIHDPNALKPNSANVDGQTPVGMPTLGLTDEEIDTLVAYLETLQ